MTALIPQLIQVVTFLLMLVVGLDCTPAGLRAHLPRGGLIAVVTLGQFVLAPLLVAAICHLVPLPPGLAPALLLLACCPSGTISNTYTFLGRGNTGLSVVLTACSCLVSVLATPAAFTLVQRWSGAGGSELLVLPCTPVIRQLLLFLALPVALGLAARMRFPSLVAASLGWMRGVSLLLIIVLIILISRSAPESLWSNSLALLAPALLLTTGLLAVGLLLGMALRLPAQDLKAVAFELPCRNLAVVALVGLLVLDRPIWVLHATSTFLIQAVILLTLAVLASRISGTWSAPAR